MIKFIFILIISALSFFILRHEPAVHRLGVTGGLFLLSFIAAFFESRIKKQIARSVFGGLLGIFAGVLFSRLAFPGVVFFLKQESLAHYSLVSDLLFGYIGFIFGYDNISILIPAGQTASADNSEDNVNFHKYKILDTSAIIDGRIMDIGATGLLEGVYIIPRFVLQELQLISDSPDSQKRIRGRRGLDLVNKMQKSEHMVVQIVDKDYTDSRAVDNKLINLAKDMNGVIVTTDFNLNKVGQIQDVKIFNVNKLAEALKPIAMPGETLEILIVKLGKDQSQGIGYLEDGTMIVVEGGSRYINKRRRVEVTSVLQSDSGRMIFAR